MEAYDRRLDIGRHGPKWTTSDQQQSLIPVSWLESDLISDETRNSVADRKRSILACGGRRQDGARALPFCDISLKYSCLLASTGSLKTILPSARLFQSSTVMPPRGENAWEFWHSLDGINQGSLLASEKCISVCAEWSAYREISS